MSSDKHNKRVLGNEHQMSPTQCNGDIPISDEDSAGLTYRVSDIRDPDLSTSSIGDQLYIDSQASPLSQKSWSSGTGDAGSSFHSGCNDIKGLKIDHSGTNKTSDAMTVSMCGADMSIGSGTNDINGLIYDSGPNGVGDIITANVIGADMSFMSVCTDINELNNESDSNRIEEIFKSYMSGADMSISSVGSDINELGEEVCHNQSAGGILSKSQGGSLSDTQQILDMSMNSVNDEASVPEQNGVLLPKQDVMDMSIDNTSTSIGRGDLYVSTSSPKADEIFTGQKDVAICFSEQNEDIDSIIGIEKVGFLDDQDIYNDSQDLGEFEVFQFQCTSPQDMGRTTATQNFNRINYVSEQCLQDLDVLLHQLENVKDLETVDTKLGSEGRNHTQQSSLSQVVEKSEGELGVNMESAIGRASSVETLDNTKQGVSVLVVEKSEGELGVNMESAIRGRASSVETLDNTKQGASVLVEQCTVEAMAQGVDMPPVPNCGITEVDHERDPLTRNPNVSSQKLKPDHPLAEKYEETNSTTDLSLAETCEDENTSTVCSLSENRDEPIVDGNEVNVGVGTKTKTLEPQISKNTKSTKKRTENFPHVVYSVTVTHSGHTNIQKKLVETDDGNGKKCVAPADSVQPEPQTQLARTRSGRFTGKNHYQLCSAVRHPKTRDNSDDGDNRVKSRRRENRGTSGNKPARHTERNQGSAINKKRKRPSSFITDRKKLLFSVILQDRKKQLGGKSSQANSCSRISNTVAKDDLVKKSHVLKKSISGRDKGQEENLTTKGADKSLAVDTETPGKTSVQRLQTAESVSTTKQAKEDQGKKTPNGTDSNVNTTQKKEGRLDKLVYDKKSISSISNVQTSSKKSNGEKNMNSNRRSRSSGASKKNDDEQKSNYNLRSRSSGEVQRERSTSKCDSKKQSASLNSGDEEVPGQVVRVQGKSGQRVKPMRASHSRQRARLPRNSSSCPRKILPKGQQYSLLSFNNLATPVDLSPITPAANNSDPLPIDQVPDIAHNGFDIEIETFENMTSINGFTCQFCGQQEFSIESLLVHESLHQFSNGEHNQCNRVAELTTIMTFTTPPKSVTVQVLRKDKHGSNGNEANHDTTVIDLNNNGSIPNANLTANITDAYSDDGRRVGVLVPLTHNFPTHNNRYLILPGSYDIVPKYTSLDGIQEGHVSIQDIQPSSGQICIQDADLPGHTVPSSRSNRSINDSQNEGNQSKPLNALPSNSNGLEDDHVLHRSTAQSDRGSNREFDGSAPGYSTHPVEGNSCHSQHGYPLEELNKTYTPDPTLPIVEAQGEVVPRDTPQQEHASSEGLMWFQSANMSPIFSDLNDSHNETKQASKPSSDRNEPPIQDLSTFDYLYDEESNQE